MSTYEKLKDNLFFIMKEMGIEVMDTDLLLRAFIHRSFINEFKELKLQHNERLEFLGDSVLGLAVAEILYKKLPHSSEGKLSELRSCIVDASSCALYMRKLDLMDYILLGKGEKKGGGKEKPSILANVFEAIIAVIFLEKGYESAKKFIQEHLKEEIEQMIERPSENFKATLQDYAQKKFQITPRYRVVKEVGPDHAKTFHVMVSINSEDMGIGIGPSKKDAEQKAAFEALKKIKEREKV